jgi:hypothetical protein
MRRPMPRLGGTHNRVALVGCRAEPGSPSRSVPFDDPGPCESNRSRVRPEEPGCPRLSDMLPSQTALRQVRARWPLTGAHYGRSAWLSAPGLGLLVGYGAFHSGGCRGCRARGCVCRTSPSRAPHLGIPPAADNGAGGGSDADHHDCSNDPLHESPFFAMTLARRQGLSQPRPD